jgi:hypothetical protein
MADEDILKNINMLSLLFDDRNKNFKMNFILRAYLISKEPNS